MLVGPFRTARGRLQALSRCRRSGFAILGRAAIPQRRYAKKEIRCAEVGFFPDCEGVMRGEDEEEVMAAAAEHGRIAHGMTDADFTEENLQIIRSHIRDQ